MKITLILETPSSTIRRHVDYDKFSHYSEFNIMLDDLFADGFIYPPAPEVHKNLVDMDEFSAILTEFRKES